jgi:hypothetical protein
VFWLTAGPAPTIAMLVNAFASMTVSRITRRRVCFKGQAKTMEYRMWMKDRKFFGALSDLNDQILWL